MNYGAEPADQVVRYTLEGPEFALKISGTAAKNFAVFALAVLRDQKKTHGKTKLVRLLREGKPLKFFSVPTDQMRDFAKAAKSHGLLYVPIRDRSDPDNIEIAVWAEDAAKVNRVIDKLQLDVVDTGEAELVADVQKGQSQPVPEKETIETEHGAVSFAVGESEEQFNMDFTPAPKQSDLETTALGRKNPSEPSSPNKGPLPDTPSPRADKIRANGQRPSVRRELGDIRVFLRQRDDARAQLPRMPVKIKRIHLTHKTPEEMQTAYNFTARQAEYLPLLQDPEYETLWAELLGGFAAGSSEILMPDTTHTPTGTLQWPLPIPGSITSPFGYRTDPLTGETSYHDGTDIAVPESTPILADADGTVTVANALDSWGGSYGYYVQIDHSSGLQTLYAHCSQICVTQGQQVQAGQVIAYVGHTGRATGNHLHFEVRENGERVDAMSYYQ